MIPLRDKLSSRNIPVITLVLVSLNILIFFWDHQWRLNSANIVFADLTMRPNRVIESLSGAPDKFALVTVFTSMFMHGNAVHLLGNLIFLLVFGPGIEETIGAWRFSLYYFGWGIVATAVQIFVNPVSNTPTLGASGAIGGVLGTYFLLFPTSVIELLIFPFVFRPIPVVAWKLLGFWFLFQVFVPQEGVANWAHVGGFLAGMLTVLAMGGRDKIIKTPDAIHE